MRLSIDSSGPGCSLFGGLVATAVVWALGAICPAAVPAFPGAEGAGAATVGGRGGRVLLVTRLDDAGPGSLRSAIESSGPRTIVFRVSGLIELESPLLVSEPFVTIAGQSSPGGVCLKNYPLVIRDTHDVIVRHLRSRHGDERKSETDAISVTDARNIILDHCSASWSIDETLSVTKNCDRVTVQWCFITESLNQSHHQKGKHGYGSLIGAEDGHLTFHHNLYAHHNSRNPRPACYPDKPGNRLDFRNNLIYNWGSRAGYNGVYRLDMNYVGNYLKPGPSTRPDSRAIAFLIGGPLTRISADGNVIEGCKPGEDDRWMFRYPAAPGLDGVLADKPFPTAPVKTEAALIARDRILAGGGATLPFRDAVDARIVREIVAGTGRIIDSQKQVGGWPKFVARPAPADADDDGMPDEWERRHELNPLDASDSIADTDNDGHTNIEEFLNGTDPNGATTTESPAHRHE